MDTTVSLREWLIAEMEDALEDNSPMTMFRLELIITPIPATPSMQSTTRFYNPAYVRRGELFSTLQSLRVSSAPTSSSTQE